MPIFGKNGMDTFSPENSYFQQFGQYARDVCMHKSLYQPEILMAFRDLGRDSPL